MLRYMPGWLVLVQTPRLICIYKTQYIPQNVHIGMFQLWIAFVMITALSALNSLIFAILHCCFTDTWAYRMNTQMPVRYHWRIWVIPLQWRHNGRDSVSNQQPHDCLLSRLFRRRSKKIWKLALLAFLRGIRLGPVNSPHKGPVTRKRFPFDDVIMRIGTNTVTNHNNTNRNT